MGLTHRDFRWDLHPDEQTIPQILRTAGYRSGHWGVEHAARDPRRIGNDVLRRRRATWTPLSRRRLNTSLMPTDTRPVRRSSRLRRDPPRRRPRLSVAGPTMSTAVTVPPYLVDAPDTRADLADFQGCVNRADAYIGRLACESLRTATCSTRR